MPTPESAAFLARKPTVPPTFDGVDFSDHQAVVNARDAIIREQWVKHMMTRLVSEELGHCYAREGVNHLEKCGKYRDGSEFDLFSDRYLQLLKETKERGWRGQQQNYIAYRIGADGKREPDIQADYPTVQQAKGSAGTDRRPGYTIGVGGKEDKKF